MYCGARYYDRTVGLFVSPDTLVPDPTNVWDYNRMMYVRGNPLKNSDPSDHTCMVNNLVDTEQQCLCGGAGLQS
jgi:hypothetical protein